MHSLPVQPPLLQRRGGGGNNCNSSSPTQAAIRVPQHAQAGDVYVLEPALQRPAPAHAGAPHLRQLGAIPGGGAGRLKGRGGRRVSLPVTGEV